MGMLIVEMIDAWLLLTAILVYRVILVARRDDKRRIWHRPVGRSSSVPHLRILTGGAGTGTSITKTPEGAGGIKEPA